MYEDTPSRTDLAPGITGIVESKSDGLHFSHLSVNTQHGHEVDDFVAALPRDRSITFDDAIDPHLRQLLEAQGFTPNLEILDGRVLTTYAREGRVPPTRAAWKTKTTYLRLSSSEFYERQLERQAAMARTLPSQIAIARVGTARQVERTQPRPNANTRFAVMTWFERDGELLPRYLSQPDGPAVAPTWSDITQRSEWRGPLNVERVLSQYREAIAVPVEFLDRIEPVTLTPRSADIPGRGLERPLR